MKKYKINLTNATDLKNFVYATSECNDNTYIMLCQGDSCRVEGRSILGVMSLDFSKEIEVEIDNPENPKREAAVAEKLKKKFIMTEI